MRFLSNLAALGLLVFIGFASVSRGDVFHEPEGPCNNCEEYDEYDESIDPQVIINNYNVTNYNWVDIDINTGWNHGHGHGHYRPRPPAVVPYPPHYPGPGHYRPICRVGRVGWSNWFELWVGNRVVQRASYGVIVNSYRYFVATGQCIGR